MVKGQKAGTALRTMFTNLAKPTKAMKNKMEELGISITDSNGEMLPMRDVLDQLREKFSGLSKDQQASAAATIFGKEAMSGALAVINASESDYTKLSKAIDKSEGSANKMSKTMEGGLGGSLRELRSAAEELGLSIFESVQPALKGMVGGLKNTVDYLNGLPKGAKLAAVGFGLITAATGPLLLGTGLLIRGIGSAMKGYAGLNRVMAKNSVEAGVNAAAQSTAGAAMMTTNTKNAKGLSRLTSMIGLTGKNTGKLTTVLKTGAKGLGVFGLAVTAIAGVVTYAYKNIDWFREGVQNLGTLFKQIGANIDWSWIKSTGDWFKKAGSATKDFGTKLLELNPYMQLAKVYFGKLDEAVSKSSDTVDVYGEGVSKGTKKALSKYTDLSEKAKVKLEEIRISHKVIGDEQFKTVSDLYTQINKEVETKLEERHQKEIGTLTKLFKESDALNNKRELEILEKTKKSNQKELDDTAKLNQQIQDIYKKAKDEKRVLTEVENQKILSLQMKLDGKVTESLSNGEKEQKVILERMKNNQSALSIKAASNVIKESAKARDKSIGDAKKKRDSVIKWAIEQRDVTKNISADEADKIIKGAKAKYRESEKNAKKQHKKVVSEAEKQNKGVKTNIDSQNGHVLSSWEKTRNKVGKHAGRMSGTAVSSFLKTSKGATKWLGKTAGTAHSKFKSVSKDAGKWFGKTYNSAKSKFAGVWNQGKDNFTKTANKIGEKTKSAYNSTSKWFGKSYKNAKTNFGDMWGSAKKNFSSIADHGWSRAKSTYNGFKKWLGATLTYIKDIGSDMGRAASDLGIKVANNAITGLNKMIAGVNKISSAITGDNLIKTIDTIGGSGSLGKKLSTGTVDGSVSTDSDGGLKQATMAIVNDKGPGNGTGGFTQEIIERKDGSMYMPKGKDVPVSLKQGDKVHSGGITQQLDKLGLLPRFSTGTPKKKNLWDKLVGKLGSNAGKYGAKLEETAHQSKDKTESAEIGIKSALEAGVKEGASALGHGMGNVMKWIEKPKELVNTMMDKMGVNFSNIPGHTGSLVRGAYSKLLPKVVDKVKDMFSEVEGGDGDASWLLKYPQLQPFGKYVGMTMNGTDNHYGLDFGMPTGTSVKAVTAGTITDASWSPYGGGNQVELKEPGGKWFQWWMHNSKLSVKKGDKVQPGDELAKSGNTGSSSTPHVHIQRMKGYPSNDTAVDPTSWLKSLTGGGSKNKKASAWRGDIVRAARQMGASVSGKDVSNIVSLINAESSGNAGAVQSTSLLDINTLMGNPAQGLLQYIPQTFRKYAVKGHTNIKSGFDQLLAFFNNKNWRTQFNPNGGWSPSGPTRYANGGISSTHKIAQISEGNKAEAIVPLTKRTRAIQLTEQIMDYLGMDTGKSNVTVNNDTTVMEKLLKQIVMLNDKSNRQTDTIIQLIKQIPQGTDMSKLEPIVSTLQGSRLNNANYTMGGAR